MSSNPPPGGIGDLFRLFGGSNPFAAISKSISQFQRGVSDFLSAVENFNKTMQQLHGTAARINDLLDTVDEPIRAFVPQIAKTIRAADAMVDQLSGPIERVAPGLSKLADILANPALTSMPAELNQLMGVLGELAHRLQPLGQIAESAGALFGLRQLTSGGRPPAAQPAPPPPPPPPARKGAAKKAPTPAKATTKKQSAAKKPGTRSSAGPKKR
jgi:ABC-type transporter Mla subunit MlaD